MLNIALSAKFDAGCTGESHGSISIAVTGGTGPYTYKWSNGEATQNITGLKAGLYWVKVTDSLGDTGEAHFFIISTSIVLDFIIQQPLTGQNNGSLTVISGTVPSAIGGATFLWSTGATTQRIDNLIPGLYTVAVTNTTGCTQVASVLLVDQSQSTLAMLNCCAADLAHSYIWARKNGLKKEAASIANRLILLRGYIQDICHYDEGACITETQLMSAVEKAGTICGCCATFKIPAYLLQENLGYLLQENNFKLII